MGHLTVAVRKHKLKFHLDGFVCRRWRWQRKNLTGIYFALFLFIHSLSTRVKIVEKEKPVDRSTEGSESVSICSRVDPSRQSYQRILGENEHHHHRRRDLVSQEAGHQAKNGNTSRRVYFAWVLTTNGIGFVHVNHFRNFCLLCFWVIAVSSDETVTAASVSQNTLYDDRRIYNSSHAGLKLALHFRFDTLLYGASRGCR